MSPALAIALTTTAMWSFVTVLLRSALFQFSFAYST